MLLNYSTLLSDSFVTMYFTKNIQLSNVPRAENGKENKITIAMQTLQRWTGVLHVDCGMDVSERSNVLYSIIVIQYLRQCV